MVKKFGCGLTECDLSHPYPLILIDQMERLSKEQQQRVFERIFQCVHLRFICTSREPLKELKPENSEGFLIHLSVPPFSQEEGKLLIQKRKPNYSLEEVHLTYLISCGNPLRIKKLACMDVDFRNIEFQELKKAIGAVYSCGIYYERGLFEAVFNLQQGVLEFLENEGLILPCKQGFIPHSIVNGFAELEKLTVDSQAILTYWCQQAKSIPDHSEIAKSLILAIKCFGYQKNLEKVLQRAIWCLEIDPENLHYFVDGAEMLLSLPYRTRATAYLAKVLKKLGEEELSTLLLNNKRASFSWVGSLISSGLVLVLSLSFVFWPEPEARLTHVHVKQTHPDFVGREDYLHLLESKIVLERTLDTVPVVVLWGEGGIGKSEMAIAAANQQLKHFDLVYWINAATDESYFASYRQLATQLNLFVGEREKIDDLVSKVHDHLENHPELTWLLIYDNAEREYELPQRGNGAILITTRDQNVWRSHPHYEVTGFSENEAFALFRKITQKEKSEGQLALIKELDNYPLSLNLVAHYVAETPWMSEESYVELLSMNKVSFLQGIPTDRRYPNALLNSWKMTADQLYAKSPKALEWLHFSSYLHPDQIPYSWIEDWIQYFNGPLDPHSLKLEANEILRPVVNQALIRFDKSSKNLSIHRLKQELFQYDEHFDPQTKEKVLQFLVHSQFQVDSLEKFDVLGEMESTPGMWPKLRGWEAHAAWFLEKHSDSCSKVDLATLNAILGSWKDLKSEYEQATPYFNESLKIRLELFGKEDLRTAIAMSNKAMNLWRLSSQLEESKAILEEALAVVEKMALNDPCYVLLITNNLSLVIEKLHDYETFKTMSEKILKIKMNVYGKRHYYTALSMHNVGVAYLRLKEYDLAQVYFEQVLQLYLPEYKGERPFSLTLTMHCLGLIFLSKGEYEQAKEFFIQSIDHSDKYYGKGHAYSARSWHYVGQLQEKLGKEEAAFNALKKAFVDLRKVYKKDHPYMIPLLEDLERVSESVGNREMIEEIRKFKLLNNA
ncbi:MAG: tetratricopeptide repeat protein [Chlamydiales bacterium]